MLKTSLIIFFKEIKCLIRDKKTFFVSLILPLILAPSMIYMTELSTSISRNNIQNNLTIAFNSKDNSFYKFCECQKNIVIKDAPDKDALLASEDILVYIVVEENMDIHILLDKSFEMELKYNPTSINSATAMGIISEYENEYRSIVTENEFESLDELNEKVSKPVETSNIFKKQKDTLLYFEMLTPIMILLYCCIGSFGTANELSVGEKEHGTWEPLLSTGVSEESITIGKILASTLMGSISVVLTVIGLVGYLVISLGWTSLKITCVGMIYLLLISVFMSAFVSSIGFLVGVYSTSYKESQLYFMPFSLLFIVPTFFITSINVKHLRWKELNIPVLNIVCIIKEILNGIDNFSHVIVVMLWLALYFSIFFTIAIKSLRKESIMFRR